MPVVEYLAWLIEHEPDCADAPPLANQRNLCDGTMSHDTREIPECVRYIRRFGIGDSDDRACCHRPRHKVVLAVIRHGVGLSRRFKEPRRLETRRLVSRRRNGNPLIIIEFAR